MRRTSIAIALTIGAMAALPSHAGLISYSEAVDGDISNTDPLTVFTLDTAGNNVIAGNIGGVGNCPTSTAPQNDCDSFGLKLSNGMEIVGLSVQAGSDLLAWRVGTGLLDLSGNQIGVLSGTSSLSGVFPLTGDLNISWTSYPTLASADYIFTIQTRAAAAVPEPDTLALLAISLMALGFTRHKRQRRD